MSAETTEFIEDLLRKKAKTKELGSGPRVTVLDDMIKKEIEISQSAIGELPPVDHEILDVANELFREIVGGQTKSA